MEGKVKGTGQFFFFFPSLLREGSLSFLFFFLYQALHAFRCSVSCKRACAGERVHETIHSRPLKSTAHFKLHTRYSVDFAHARSYARPATLSLRGKFGKEKLCVWSKGIDQSHLLPLFQ